MKILEQKNIMLDIETMGTGSNAAIIAIGAVKFGDETESEFYTPVDLESSLNSGGIVDGSTIKWWSEQRKESRTVINDPAAIPLANALLSFSNWLAGEKFFVWGNGTDFDNVIVENAYLNCNIDLPWNPFDNLCYRTFKNIFTHINIQKKGIVHNALDDARNQAQHLIDLIKHSETPNGK